MLNREAFDSNPYCVPFGGVVWVQFLCPNCDKFHYESLGALDNQGTGFDLAAQWVEWRMKSLMIAAGTTPRIMGIEAKKTGMYALEMLADNETVRFRQAVIPKDVAGKATARMRNSNNGSDIFDYVASDGVEIFSDTVSANPEPGAYRNPARFALESFAALVTGTAPPPAVTFEGNAPTTNDASLRRMLDFLK